MIAEFDFSLNAQGRKMKTVYDTVVKQFKWMTR